MTRTKFLTEDKREFWIDEALRLKLENIKSIIKKNWDCVFLIDGRERAGKSTLGLTCAYYLYPQITLNNLARGTADCIKKIGSLPNKSIMVIDEGSLSFNSKDAMVKEQKRLFKILDVVGQKNMIFIIIAPSIFDLSRSIVVRRARFLLHVYTGKNLSRGRFGYYGERQLPILYDKGKKKFGTYVIEAKFYGQFADFIPFGENYFKIKEETLLEILHEPPTLNRYEERWKKKTEALLYLITKKHNWMNQLQLSKELKKTCGIDITNAYISSILQDKRFND